MSDLIIILNGEINRLKTVEVNLKNRVKSLETVIREVLADSESIDGGWGPDVTTRLKLQDVLERGKV